MMRKAFTLIEVMISISIFSVVMIFLYQSYATLNLSNANLKEETQSIVGIEKLKRIVYLDFSLAKYQSVKIQKLDKQTDFVTFQGGQSIHKRYNPYTAYILKEEKLYRLESLNPFQTHILDSRSEFDSDYLGEVESFRVYKSSSTTKELYLIHIDFKKLDDIILKVKVLNEE